MGTFTNLIIVLNLLQSRRVVPRPLICKICGVTNRTAYRYIDSLSEAGYPVYYDKRNGGYRLSRSNSQTLQNLSPSDHGLIIAALEFLANHVNTLYQQRIHEITKLLATAHDLPLESFLTDWSRCIKGNKEPADLSEMLVTSLMRFAITNSRSVRLLNSNIDSDSSIEIKNPTLKFAGKWLLDDKEGSEQSVIDISSVGFVSVE